jgi:hypothetical protein
MPLVRISRRVGFSTAENRLVLDAVHAALVEGFKIPDGDRHQQLLELDASHFEIPRGRGPGYTLVEITAFPGRSVEAKRMLYQALARRCAAAGIPPQDLFVVLLEPPLESWSPRDGVSSADRKPGFALDV